MAFNYYHSTVINKGSSKIDDSCLIRIERYSFFWGVPHFGPILKFRIITLIKVGG